MQKQIGDLGLGEGSLGHAGLHALAGCIAAEAQGADCAAGGLGAIVASVFSGMQTPPQRTDFSSDATYQAAFDNWQAQVLAEGELASMAAAYVFSGGKAENVSAITAISNSAIANNYLTHAQFDALEGELIACGEDAACKQAVVAQYGAVSAEQQHQLAMCGTDIACMAPHLQAIMEARTHPLRVALLTSRGLRSTALQELEYQVELAYLGLTESAFDSGLFEGIYTPDFSAYFAYPEWANAHCAALSGSACMARFQQDVQRGLIAQGAGSGAAAFTISAGAGLAVSVAPSAALAMRQCAANPVCFSNLRLDLTVALGELTGATAGQIAFTVSTAGAVAGKLVLTQGDQILAVVDDLGQMFRPVSQVPDDLGRLLVTNSDGVTGYLDNGRFVAVETVQVPGGGLQAHENAGGHLIDRHVGKSDVDLIARLNSDPKIKASSSFPDLATAEQAVSSTLNANAANISQFLSGSNARLVLNHSMGSPVGNVMSRGSTISVPSANVRVVIQRDATMPTGYRIITGFPVP